ncbi:M23 family metallopeptidase [Candidatus Sumerlaeota bacterium]|nr:M23 family metallopeptidase [Candidatus Sumerlaeota bacterium]
MAALSAPHTAPASSAPTGLPFSSGVCLVLVFGPLILLGLVLCADRNIESHADRYAERFVFRVSLKQDVSSREAEDLAARWEESPAWRNAKTTTPAEDFADVPELKPWLEDPRNQTIAASMPRSIALWPADILDSRIRASDLERALLDSPEVDRVFYDRAGLSWVKRAMRSWNAVGTALAAFFAALAVAMAALGGWFAERLHPSEPRAAAARRAPSLFRHPGLIALSSSSGALAILVLAIPWTLARYFSGTQILFLSTWQIASLVAFGICLGFLSAGFRYWIGRRLARLLLPLVGVVALSGVGVAATGASDSSSVEISSLKSAAYRPSLPDRTRPLTELDVASDLSQLDPGERRALIEEKRRLYDYLDEWRQRALKGQELDRQNRDAAKAGLAAARFDRERMENSIAARFERAERLSDGVRFSRLESPPTIGGGAGRTRRDLAAHLLRQDAYQTFFMLDIERKRLEDLHLDIARMEGDLQVFDRVSSRYGDQSPESIEKEKRQVAEEIVLLINQNRMLNTVPKVLSAEEAAETSGGRAAPSASAVPLGRSWQDGGYYFLADRGDLVHAAVGGRVLFASYFMGLGNTVILDHGDGYSSVYAFLDDVIVRPDQEVQTGAYVGSAGIIKRLGKGGIRFEVRKDGKRTPPSDLPALARGDLRALIFEGKKTKRDAE